MPLAHGEKLSTYRIQALPSSHLLKVLGFRKGTQFTFKVNNLLRGL